MKLRILGNSIRLRLTKSEVSKLAIGETVYERTYFGPNNHLEYALSIKNIPNLKVDFQNGKISLTIPKAAGDIWATGEDISLKYQFPSDQETELSVLIEKDFKCKTERVGENEDDMYPNPDC